MRKTLDFNAIERPVLELKMKDAEHTKLSLITPTLELIEKLQANRSAIPESIKNGTEESIKAVFTLAADFISCNQENITVTAEELRNKYKMSLEDAVIFFSVYMDFIEEIKNVKN